MRRMCKFRYGASFFFCLFDFIYLLFSHSLSEPPERRQGAVPLAGADLPPAEGLSAQLERRRAEVPADQSEGRRRLAAAGPQLLAQRRQLQHRAGGQPAAHRAHHLHPVSCRCCCCLSAVFVLSLTNSLTRPLIDNYAHHHHHRCTDVLHSRPLMTAPMATTRTSVAFSSGTWRSSRRTSRRPLILI